MALVQHRANSLVTIQILRGAAAWSVVFYHFMMVFFEFKSSTFIGWLFAWHGNLGVDVFFVLSGFIMHHTLHARAYAPTEFAVRRIIRIMPAYWVATFVFVFFISIGLVSSESEHAQWDIRSLLQSLFFIPQESVSGVRIFPVLAVGWTLDFEMFFYATLAFSLCFSRRLAPLLATGILLVLPFLADAGWPLSSITTSSLLYEFILGMMISACYQRGIIFPKRRGLSMIFGVVILVLAAAYLVASAPYYHFVVSALVVAGFLFFEPALTRSPNRAIFFLVKIGDLSYGAYLYHLIVLYALLNVFGNPAGYAAIVSLILATTFLTTLLSIISYRLVEQRFGIWATNRYARREVTLCPAADDPR